MRHKLLGEAVASLKRKLANIDDATLKDTFMARKLNRAIMDEARAIGLDEVSS